jgi:hypothetical protein
MSIGYHILKPPERQNNIIRTILIFNNHPYQPCHHQVGQRAFWHNIVIA